MPARDSVGKPACEICRRRLRSHKKDEPYSIGRAHCACVLRKARDSSWEPLAPSGAVEPVRCHKKRTLAPESPSGQRTLSSTHLLLQPRHAFFTHGWQLHLPPPVTSGLAYRWFCLYLRTRAMPAPWFDLRGNASQLDARQPLPELGAEQHRLSLVGPTQAACRRLLESHGVQTACLHLAALKLLRSGPGLGLQPVHYDVPRYKDAVQCYSVLMYCTGTTSTAVPKLDAATMRPLFTDGEELSAKQHALAEKLCAEENFISFPVQAGATLVFSAATPHYGVRNIASTDRVVLYALFSPSEEPAQDDTQRFPLGVTDD